MYAAEHHHSLRCNILTYHKRIGARQITDTDARKPILVEQS